jgi:hypothetical protein
VSVRIYLHTKRNKSKQRHGGHPSLTLRHFHCFFYIFVCKINAAEEGRKAESYGKFKLAFLLIYGKLEIYIYIIYIYARFVKQFEIEKQYASVNSSVNNVNLFDLIFTLDVGHYINNTLVCG